MRHNAVNKKVLLVFAKAPIAGHAKTRLIPKLGPQGAADLHEQLLNHTLNNVIDADSWDTQLWCATDPEQTFFKQCAERYNIPLFQQQGADLGERMYHALAIVLSNYKSAVLIGTDCPLLDQEKIAAVFEDLTDDSLVITPAEDGGYVLIGASRIEKEIFAKVDWGTSNVMSQTLRNIKQINCDAKLHPQLWDVDLPEDLVRLYAIAEFNQALAIS